MTKTMRNFAALSLLVAGSIVCSTTSYAAVKIFFAVVGPDATIARGNAVGIDRSPGAVAGAYIVRFPQKVSDCAYVATVGPAQGSINDVGIVTVTTSFDSDKAVFVQTRDKTGQSVVDRGFHLIVVCP
jgi:hypothetical protein